jgi:hypothetical protein
LQQNISNPKNTTKIWGLVGIRLEREWEEWFSSLSTGSVEK